MEKFDLPANKTKKEAGFVQKIAMNGGNQKNPPVKEGAPKGFYSLENGIVGSNIGYAVLFRVEFDGKFGYNQDEGS
ncbi:MAG: hypothetical protein ACI4WX_04060 [Aristaeellaceae bacterium]